MIAKKHVLQGFQKNADLLSGISALEVQLNDVFGSCLPNMRDYDNRRDLIHIFNEIAREIYGNFIFFCPRIVFLILNTITAALGRFQHGLLVV